MNGDDQRGSMLAALDQLIIETAHLNRVLADLNWPTVTSPEPHKPIEPFFADLLIVIRKCAEVAGRSKLERNGDGG